MILPVDYSQVDAAIANGKIDELSWSSWRAIPSPECCRDIAAPAGFGVYHIRNVFNKQNVQFGIGDKCQTRMKSLFPTPYGIGTRNNQHKRGFILYNWQALEYRTLSTVDRKSAKHIEDYLKSKRNHIFNT